MVPKPSLILVGDETPDARALATLLAHATDGSALAWTDPLIEGVWDTKPGLMLVHGRPVEAVLREAPCPVAVPPHDYAARAPAALRRIGVAFDGWDESHAALVEAATLAEGAGAELVVLMVADPRTAASAAALDDRDALLGHRAATVRYLEDVGVSGQVLDGPVVPALADACRRERLDLLALGSRRHGPLARVLPGSVSLGLLRKQPDCPLLICPRLSAVPQRDRLVAIAGLTG
jgi:nucleotide-binding universal stress UspA family protein